MNAVRDVVALAAVGVLAVAGCATTIAGSPVATVTRPPVSAPVTPTLSESIDPCNLLAPADIQQFGLAPTGRDTAAGGRACSWKKTGDYSVGIEIWDHLGLRDLGHNARIFTPFATGRHHGYTVLDTSVGACGTYMEITVSSMVDVAFAGIEDEATECQLADEYTRLIEPRLPKG